ncbi:hypothetical protein ACF0H5_022510 [Mactra antiquata]
MALWKDDIYQQIDQIPKQFDKLGIHDMPSNKLKQCLIGLMEWDRERLVDGVTACVKNAKIVPMLIKAVNIVGDLLEDISTEQVLQNLPSLPAPLVQLFKVVKVVFSICGRLCKPNMTTALQEVFGVEKEKVIKEKCYTACKKFNHAISYMEGLPDPRTLSQEEKDKCLQQLSSDLDLFLCFDEVAGLGHSIKLLANSDTLDEFDKLMTRVQMYCFLTTLRELYLMYRIGIQLLFIAKTEPIQNVLKSQRNDDKDVLEFLWKPTVKNVHLVHSYNPDDWPIIAGFLKKRKLVENLIDNLKEKKIQIVSVANHKLLTRCKPLFNSPVWHTVRCKNSTTDDLSSFSFVDGCNNIFSIHGNYYLPALVHLEKSGILHVTFAFEKIDDNGQWHIIKIESDTPNGDPYYLFKLKANPKMCLYTGLGGLFVYAKRVNYPHSACFWKLNEL